MRPRKIVLVENAENSLFEIGRELADDRHFRRIASVLADCKDAVRMKEVFLEYQPTVVFHAAAYKHVPLMEANPVEAVRNNAVGTRIVAAAAAEIGVKRFVLVSTDKAVSPATAMGASKALAEWAVEAAQHRYPDTRFATVRFGNVLGSSGSVVPIFRRQIAAGGPVTVTDEAMTRYFMTIPEAVQLIIRSGSLADGGEVFVLEMGDPVKIVDLARNMIRLSGAEPDVDIAVEIVGRRPGEKIHEELFNPDERPQPTPAEKIMAAARPPLDPEWVDDAFGRVEELVYDGDATGLAASCRSWPQSAPWPPRQGPGPERPPPWLRFSGPMDLVQEVGAYAGLAAVVGLAVLSALYFSQARDLKRLREWAGRAPERSGRGSGARAAGAAGCRAPRARAAGRAREARCAGEARVPAKPPAAAAAGRGRKPPVPPGRSAWAGHASRPTVSPGPAKPSRASAKPGGRQARRARQAARRARQARACHPGRGGCRCGGQARPRRTARMVPTTRPRCPTRRSRRPGSPHPHPPATNGTDKEIKASPGPGPGHQGRGRRQRGRSGRIERGEQGTRAPQAGPGTATRARPRPRRPSPCRQAAQPAATPDGGYARRRDHRRRRRAAGCPRPATSPCSSRACSWWGPVPPMPPPSCSGRRTTSPPPARRTRNRRTADGTTQTPRDAEAPRRRSTRAASRSPC